MRIVVSVVLMTLIALLPISGLAAAPIPESYRSDFKPSAKSLKFAEKMVRKMTVEERENIDVQTHEELEFDIKEASEVPF